MLGSCHGPLSDLMQPPWSTQVQVPPRNSGSSLKNNTDSQNFQIAIQVNWEITPLTKSNAELPCIDNF